MRPITLLFLAGILMSGSASEANAQTSAADHWYVNVSIGGSPQDVRDEAPFTSVTITNVTVTDVKDSHVGVNVGVDGTYEIMRIAGLGIGVGGFVRYVGASLDFPTLTGTTREKVLAGGHQWGIGLRVRF